MRTAMAIGASLLLVLGGLGCMGAPIVPPLGIAYTKIEAPISLRGDFGSKRGEASVTSYLGLVSTGDASVRAAARNGGISDVKHVDYEFNNVFFFYQRYTTVVFGD